MNSSIMHNTRLNIPIWRQLRWTLIFFTVLVAVIPVLAIGQFVLVQTREQSTRQVINQLESVATLKQAALNNWLADADVVLDAYLSSRVTYAQMTAFTLSAESLPGQLVTINSTLTNAINNTISGESPIFSELFLYNQDGRIVASSNEVQIGKVIRLQPYFTPSLQGNYVQYPYYEVGSGVLAMFTTRPLVTDAGNTVGVIAARLNLETLGNIMAERSGLGDTGETYLVSVENSYLLTPSRFEGYETNRSYHSLGIDQALSGQSGSGTYENYRSPAARVIGVYQWQPGLQAALLAEISEDEALASFQEVARAIGTVTLIAAVAAAVLALFVVDRVVRPINSLTRVATRIAQGDYGERASVQSRNEVGVLAETFNLMTDQLQNVLNTLEERVANRTRDLQTIADVTAQISTILDLEQLLTDVTNRTKESFSLYHAHIYLLDENGGTLQLAAGAGEPGRIMRAQGRRIAVSNENSLVARAGRTRRGVIVNDVTLAADFLANPLLPDTQSELAVPMLVGDQLVGVLDVQSELKNRFTDEDARVYTTLAGQIAVAVLNAGSFSQIKAAQQEILIARAEAETLYNVSSRLNDARTPDDVVAAVLSYLEAQNVASISLLYVESDANGQPEWAEIKASYNTAGTTGIPVGSRFYLPEFPFSRLWTSNPDTPTLTGDVFASPVVDENTRQLLAQTGFRALAIMPLYVQNRWVGIITASWADPVTFSGQDERILTTLGQQATSVVDALRSFEQTAEAQQEAEALYLLSSLINEAGNEQQLVEAAVQYALHPDASVVSLMLWDNYDSQHAANLNIAGEWRNDGQQPLLGISLPVASFPAVASIDRNDVSWCNDISADPGIDPMSKDTYEALGFRAYVYAPLTIGDRWIGNLGIYSAKPRVHSNHEIRILRGISKQFATAVEQMRLNRQLIKRASEMETVAQVSATTTTILDPDGLLQSVVDLTKERFGLYHAHIYLVDEQGDNLVLAAGAGEPGRIMKEQGRRIAIQRMNSLVARAARDRESVISNDVTQESDFLPNPLLPETRAEMALPMIVADRLIGVLDVQADQVNVFTSSDAQVLSTLADQTAVAIENARAFKEQQQVAERLREVDRLKSQFLANMSHELRTPLNSIIGYAEVLLDGIDGDLSEEAIEDVQAIHGGGRHLLTIINDILDLAKIEAGQMFIDRRETDVRTVLDEVTNTVSILAKNKGIYLDIVPDEGLPTVYGDPVRIKQIILNLVNNAIKFTETGGVTINIGARDSNLIVRVTDTGIGLTTQEMGGLFQQFHQVDGSPTRRAGGTGLGLVITRHLVHMHEGDIFVESEKGKGSTFWFTLPVFVGQQVQKA